MEHTRMNMRKRTKDGEKSAPSVSLANNAAIGALLALILCLILLFVASWLLVSGRLPQDFMGTVTIAVFFLSSMFGATYAIRRHKSRSLIVGLVQGGILYALTFVIGAFAERSSLVGDLSLALLLAALAGGVAASFVPTKRRKRRT